MEKDSSDESDRDEEIEESYSEDELVDMTVAELKDIAKRNKLSISGRKAI